MLSSNDASATHDRIALEILPKYAHAIEHVHVWGYDDVRRLLEATPRSARTTCTS